jgi:hypothetical protein
LAVCFGLSIVRKCLRKWFNINCNVNFVVGGKSN